MRIDRQTLAWMNNSKTWIKILKPNYIPPRSGIAEAGELPYYIHPTIYEFTHPITNKKERRFSLGGPFWGTERWHHSPQLIDNPCWCPRCTNEGDLYGNVWWYYPIDLLCGHPNHPKFINKEEIK